MTAPATPHERLPPPPRTLASATYRVRTPDGAAITLHAYGDASDTRPPVLLCHGAFSNHVIYDLGRGVGLAPSLAADGRRVFTVDLRGRERSVVGGRRARARALLRGWTMDDLLTHDLPTAFDAVLQLTGARALDFVGHSMGGMLIVAHLSAQPDPRVRRVVSVGSADFGSMEAARTTPSLRQLDLAVLLRPVTMLSPVIPMQPSSRWLAPALARLPSALPNPALETGNVEPEVLAHYYANGLVSVPSRKLAQFARLPAGDALAHYTTPTLFCAGAVDLLVSPAVARRAYEGIASPTKRLVLFGRAHGHRADYGHSDLLIGRHAAAEVFPEIAAFLG